MRILYQEEDGWLAYSFHEPTNSYFMHVVYTGRWGKSTYKKFLNLFVNACLTLGQQGITEFYSFCYNDKQVKFNQLFGFVPLGKVIDDNSDEITIMRFNNVW